ncbi:MAG: Na/Pi cotransporter family protein [Gammaproteobacteria bacterium]|nr:Na/Pi cotransporter family protein [Gammaproteobacteria bacterium]
MTPLRITLAFKHLRGFIVYSALLLVFFLFIVEPSMADSALSEGVNWFDMIQGMLFGLVVFLFGMGMMGDAMKAAAGDQMKHLLHKLTTNRVKGMATGLGVTAIIQSSSVTTVMLVSFVSVGLMSFARTIPAILGADVGTTITAQIVAFKITHFAPYICIGGFSLFFNQRTREIGEVLFGLGLILFGMGLMGGAMKPLRSYEPFMQLMIQMDSVYIGILIGAAFTALVQSSSATMGVVIALASQGLISLETGIALALGANIGTCVTAGLAAIGKSRAAVRVAMAHVFIKILGVLIILPFISPLTEFVVMISPQAGIGASTAMAEVLPRQVANAHTVFNVCLALLFLPFTDWIARVIVKLLPERRLDENESFKPLELPEALIRTSPAMAIEAVRREICRIGRLVEEGMQRDIGEAMVQGDEQKLQVIAERDHEINRLYRNLVSIIPRICQEKLSPEESRQIGLLWELADLVEITGDSIKELAQSRRHRIFRIYQVSDETKDRVIEFENSVTSMLSKALSTIEELGQDQARSINLAYEVLAMKKEINLLADDFKQYLQEKRLNEEREADGHLSQERVRLYAVETDLVARMRGSANYARKIAKAVIDTTADKHIKTSGGMKPGGAIKTGKLVELVGEAR